MSTSEVPTAAVDPDLEAGQVVGEYRVEGKLGQGGFGTVYRGVHPLIGKVVAIKVLARKYSVDPEMVSRFIAEARAVNQIRHRNIIDIFSFGQLADGRQYYVMEYLDGEPLDALHRRSTGSCSLARGAADPARRSRGRSTPRTRKGIAHRDLKPENMFLAHDPDGGDVPEAARLRHREAARARATALKHKTRTGIADRHAVLHVARAVPRQGRRSPHRHLRVRRR